MAKASKLIIVESPAKIKTISKFLGGDFILKSTLGHVMDLPSKELGITIDEKAKHIKFEYEPLKGKEKVISEICKAAAGAKEIYLASDPDREGEIIAWHIGQEIARATKNANIYRITFNEITKPAILSAIEHKASIDEHKVEAQQARRALDRWVGYEVSPILWRKIKRGLSAGRVQSAALLLICNRENEIVNFKQEESWSIHGIFMFEAHGIEAELVRIKDKAFKLINKAQADATLDAVKKQAKYSVKDISVKKRLKAPLPPFMTSTLQQAAFNQLGFAVERTMSIAQKLYEGVPMGDASSPQALITYMRTDSLRLSDTALNAARSFIDKVYGDDYLPKKANVYAKKAAQDAHEAIRPIDVTITPADAERYLPAEQAKLYGLIWKRFVASQMTPAEYSQRTVTIEGGDFLFRVTGSTLMFDGFLKVYMIEDDEEEKNTVVIPKELSKNSTIDLSKATSKQHFTQPPPRYNEATLVKEMEKQGIGRPSTYAATLETIQKRSYVTKDKKRFVPTELGKSVNEMLITNLPDIISLKFTAKMEEDLDKIAQGTSARDQVLLSFYKKFKKDLALFGGDTSKKKAVETDLTCPSCGSPLVIRFSKNGEFLGCSAYPECTFTANFSRTPEGKLEIVPIEGPKTTDLSCPKCGKPLVERMGKFGAFLSCSGYPQCKYIHQEALKMPCPQCGGTIVKRVSKRGPFFGCANYPKCNFVIFGNVEERACPQCKAPYMLVATDKSGHKKYTCNNKECGYTESE